MTNQETEPTTVDHALDEPGTDIVKYAELLSEAHLQGLSRIETRIVQIPTEENSYTAICMATVTTKRGVFSDLADANPHNVRDGAGQHIIRVALTRAKARAIRDAVDFAKIAARDEDDSDTGRSTLGAFTDTRPMTDPQKTRLLALMEKQGKTGEAAESELCRELGVAELSRATLPAASDLIKRLSSVPPSKQTAAK